MELVLVRDHVRSPRSPTVRGGAAPPGRLTPLWLPGYPPPLNRIAQRWRFLTQRLADHRSGADAAGLDAAAAALLSYREAHVHTDVPPGIRLVNTFCEAA